MHQFLASDVNLVVGTDDPGNFDVTLESELDWVARQAGLSADALGRRLGDPRRFRLGQRRERRRSQRGAPGRWPREPARPDVPSPTDA